MEGEGNRQQCSGLFMHGHCLCSVANEMSSRPRGPERKISKLHA
jgi:hypothetical protein